MKKVYISGAITGLPVEQYTAKFNAAELLLTNAGYQPINPIKLDHSQNTEWHQYMRTDIAELLTADAIFLLPGWENSRGARLELHLAAELGLVILHSADITTGNYVEKFGIEVVKQAGFVECINAKGFESYVTGGKIYQVLQTDNYTGWVRILLDTQSEGQIYLDRVKPSTREAYEAQQAKLTPQTNTEPVEYVECVDNSEMESELKKGKVYIVTEYNKEHYSLDNPNRWILLKSRFKPSTREAYELQQKTVVVR